MFDGFDASVAPFRRELLAHCYRMTGSVTDAEDALQESLVRAWRGYAGFDGRASLRTWLHRVVTNTCLNFLEARKNRSMPHESRPQGTPAEAATAAPDFEPVWIEPFPDTLIDDPDRRPDAAYTRRESVRLAFVVALQRLPARQRAVLILRDVVALSAEETAEALELTVAACNSLLQRARDTLDKPIDPPARSGLAELLAKYVHAWETGDAGELISLLRDDAIASMPPSPLWVRGAPEVIDCMQRLVWTGPAIRLVATAANDAIAYGIYQQRDGQFAFAGISVLDIRGDRIASIHSFLAIDPKLDPARYNLPLALH